MMHFFSPESTSLEKTVNLTENIVETPPHKLDQVYEIDRCLNWIKSNDFRKVCLQFPDHLLPDSSVVALKLQNVLNAPVYILGDTAYGSCCIDYVAAAHVQADAIIHYGPICFSKPTGKIAHLNIFEKLQLDVNELANSCHQLINEAQTEEYLLLIDTPYIYLKDDIKSILLKEKPIEICTVEDNLNLENKVTLFVGNNQRKIDNLYFGFNPKCFYYLQRNSFVNYEMDPKVLKKRYYLAEKIKDSNTIGIVIGTMAVKNYLKLIDRLKKLIQLHCKKYYLISVGKPTVTKLANFPEIDVFVVITCAMNEIFDSRDFYKPLVTPYDIELALNPNVTNLKFSYDYNSYLNNVEDVDNLKIPEEKQNDVSLVTGKVRVHSEQEAKMDTDESQQVALKNEGTIALNSNFGAGFLKERSWKGLEQNLGETSVTLAETGRKGIAQEYQNEMI